MHRVMGWISIIILYTVMIFMTVAGLEIMDGLRNTQLKVPILLMVIATWVLGGFMSYMIHEYMAEETPR